MTNQIIIDGQSYQTGSLTHPPSGRLFREAWTAPVDHVIQLDVERMRAPLKQAAWAHAEKLLATGFATITTSAGTYSYGIDAETRENLAGLAQIVSQIATGILPADSMPNPRSYYPKGESSPIQLSHTEIVMVAVGVAAAKDAIVNAYLAHKSYIMDASRTAQELEAYDVTANWP